MAPAATTGPTTFAASSRRRSVFGSLNVATRPDERDPADDVAADFDPDVDAGADFLRALRRSATLLPPRAGGCRILRQPSSRAGRRSDRSPTRRADDGATTVHGRGDGATPGRRGGACPPVVAGALANPGPPSCAFGRRTEPTLVV